MIQLLLNSLRCCYFDVLGHLRSISRRNHSDHLPAHTPIPGRCPPFSQLTVMSSSPPIAHKPKLDPSCSRRPPPASLWVWAADRWPVSDIIKVSGIGHSPEYDIFPAPLGRGYTGSSSPTAHELLSQPSSKGAGSDSALLRVALKTIGNLPTYLPSSLPTPPPPCSAHYSFPFLPDWFSLTLPPTYVLSSAFYTVA